MTGKRRAGKDPVRPPAPPVAPPPPRAAADVADPTIPPVVISPRPSRRDERRQRKREQRKRFGFAGGGVALVIGAILLATIVVGGVKAVTHTSAHKRTQRTVLLQIQGQNRTAVGSVLLASDPARHAGVEVLVPSRLITDVCGFGSQNFGNILALPGGIDASVRALSTVLHGVTIDGSWVLSTSQFAGLVDGVGGITTQVDTNVIQRSAGGGGRILVPAGPNQHLNGAQAVEYLSYQPASDQTAAAQLLRMKNVVDSTIQALGGRTNTGAQAVLRSLGRGGTSTLGSGKLVDLLDGIAADDQSSSATVDATDLPVTPIDAGGAIPSYRPDDSAGGIPQLLKFDLAGSVPATANSQHATVYLLNGTGQVGLVGTACPKLASNGFTYAGSDNAPSFSNARSEVEIFSNSAISQGQQLAKALGLPASDVRRGTLNQDVAKFVVILGGDYKP